MFPLIAVAHDERLQELRAIADKLKEDSWKYPSVETLLGLSNNRF